MMLRAVPSQLRIRENEVDSRVWGGDQMKVEEKVVDALSGGEGLETDGE